MLGRRPVTAALGTGGLWLLATATGSGGVTPLHGIGPSGAARLLVEVADITRFPSKAHFASWTGTAPVDASSGDTARHRLSRGGNRQINHVPHITSRPPTSGLRDASRGRLRRHLSSFVRSGRLAVVIGAR